MLRLREPVVCFCACVRACVSVRACVRMFEHRALRSYEAACVRVCAREQTDVYVCVTRIPTHQGVAEPQNVRREFEEATAAGHMAVTYR